MDWHRGEVYSDQSGTDHHSYPHSDDSSNHHHYQQQQQQQQQYNNHNRSFDNHHRWDSSDDHYQTDEDERFQNHQFNNFSNSELSNSPSVWEDNSSGGGYSDFSVPLSGRKRHFQPPVQPSPRDSVDVGNVVKLYVGNVPRTVTEGEIRSVFREYGIVVEVIILRDKRTAQQQECCFVKYANTEEADQAIWALHGQYTFAGGRFPVKVKYADGERDRLAKPFSRPPSAPVERALTFKLYVLYVNKQASELEIEEIFSPFGVVTEVFIVRDEMKQPKGCAFVQYTHREMALTAINALHGSYVMRGCKQPLVVRIATPKKPRVGDSRTSPGFDRVTGHILPSYPHKEVSQLTEPLDDLECEWSEHICPDGYSYYYNCVTCESRWEKPEEYRVYEQQQLLKLDQPQQ